MTLIVGMNLGSYALIGADTRVSSYEDGEHHFTDDAAKIRRIGLGIALIAITRHQLPRHVVNGAVDNRVCQRRQTEVYCQ